MEYEFNISPDTPVAKYDTEGCLDTSTINENGKSISQQRTGIISLDSGDTVFVKDGEILDLTENEIYKLERPQPISSNIHYTQSSVFKYGYSEDGLNIKYALVNLPADSRNMTNGNYAETRATGTGYSNFEYIQMDLNGIFNIKGVVVGCDWNGPNPYAVFVYNGVVYSPDSTSESGIWGGWGKEYSEYKNVEYSLDGINWTFLFNTGTFTKPVQIYEVSVFARYIRITDLNYDYIAVTEFYAF